MQPRCNFKKSTKHVIEIRNDYLVKLRWTFRLWPMADKKKEVLMKRRLGCENAVANCNSKWSQQCHPLAYTRKHQISRTNAIRIETKSSKENNSRRRNDENWAKTQAYRFYTLLSPVCYAPSISLTLLLSDERTWEMKNWEEQKKTRKTACGARTAIVLLLHCTDAILVC